MIKINKNINFSYSQRPLLVAEISGNHNGSKKTGGNKQTSGILNTKKNMKEVLNNNVFANYLLTYFENDIGNEKIYHARNYI